MCGRFTLTASSYTQLALDFSVDVVPDVVYQPRYNIAPSQPVLAIVSHGEQRRLGHLRWGLVPSWAKDPSIGYKMINARSETVHEKPSFRQAFAHRRCLILADGFFEWDRSTSPRQPHYFFLPERKPFAFAGLWETWRASQTDAPLHTCTIITREANDAVKPIHERMPVLFEPDLAAAWLTDVSLTELKGLLQTSTSKGLLSYPVSTLVNSPKNESSECIQPL